MSDELNAQQNNTGGQEEMDTVATVAGTQQEQTGQEAGDTLLGGAEASQTEAKPAGQATEQGAEQQGTVEYTDFSLPDGVQVDDAILGDFKALAAKSGLSQEAAQGLIDLQGQMNQKAAEAVMQQREAWRQSITCDPEFGGANLAQTVKDAKALLSKHDESGNILAMLEQSGFGDNPDVIKFLAKVQRSLPKEDDVLTGKEGVKDTRPLAERLWPN